MEQQGIKIECLDESLLKLGQNEKVYPWLSIGVYPWLPFGYLYGGERYEIQQAEAGELLLKKTYTSKWKRLLVIILTGGQGSILFQSLTTSQHVKKYNSKEIKKVIRASRSVLTSREAIYHMYVESGENKVDVHVFKLLDEEAQTQLDALICSVVPTESIVDEEI